MARPDRRYIQPGEGVITTGTPLGKDGMTERALRHHHLGLTRPGLVI